MDSPPPPPPLFQAGAERKKTCPFPLSDGPGIPCPYFPHLPRYCEREGGEGGEEGGTFLPLLPPPPPFRPLSLPA